MNTNYRVVLKGVGVGYLREDVAEKLAPHFKISIDEADQMLDQHDLVVRNGIDFQAAVKYVEELESWGCSCEVRPEANVGLTLTTSETLASTQPVPASPLFSTPPEDIAVSPSPRSHLPTAQREWNSVAEIKPQRNYFKRSLIVTVILSLLVVVGGGYFVWASTKQSEAMERARIENEAKLQIERTAHIKREAEALARQESLKLSLIEKEEAIRLSSENAAAREAEMNAVNVQAQSTFQPGAEAVQSNFQNATLETVLKAKNNAIEQMLDNARSCLAKLNYSCVITNADNVLSFEPGNKLAHDFKRTAEDAQKTATENIRID